jgi:hypothetical protein
MLFRFRICFTDIKVTIVTTILGPCLNMSGSCKAVTALPTLCLTFEEVIVLGGNMMYRQLLNLLLKLTVNSLKFMNIMPTH